MTGASAPPHFAKLHFNEMVDPNYVLVASIEKRYLPVGPLGLGCSHGPVRMTLRMISTKREIGFCLSEPLGQATPMLQFASFMRR